MIRKLLKLILVIVVIQKSVSKIEYIEDIQQKFLNFISEFNKSYTPEEYQTKFLNFKNNFLKFHSKKFLQENKFQTGITKFFDLSEEEFKEIYLNLKTEEFEKMKNDYPEIKITVEDQDLPENFDWREKGAVGKVKNQYVCGSCWTFSITGNIEGLYYIKYGNLKLFSEQQLIDCDRYDYGCRGGFMASGFKYLKEAGGIQLEQDYYYRGFDDECSFNKMKIEARIQGFQIAKTEDEEEIKKMLVGNGPLSIGINGEGLQAYKGGIIDFSSPQECPSVMNHGVLLVGYGVENGEKYWIVKNSWGSDWGESGYFRISRGKGTCGVNKYVLTAEIK